MRFFTVLIFTLLSVNAQAQITFTAADLDFTANTDTILYSRLDTLAVTSLPQVGEDMFWDYSDKDYNENTYYKAYETYSGSEFPTANMRRASSVNYVGVLFPTYDYYRIDSTGFFSVGIMDIDVNIPLQSVTSNPADTISAIAGPRLDFEPFIKFPISYPDVYETTYLLETNLIANVPTFSLSNFLIHQKMERQTKIEIIGWGRVAIKNPITTAIDTFEAIYQRKTMMRIDSFFDANNNPLPATLLAPLGRTQGDTSTIISQGFLIKGARSVAIEFFTTGNNVTAVDIDRALFLLNPPVNTTSAKVELINHSVYPNPIQSNQFQLEIDKNNNENWQLDIYNTIGQRIHNQFIINKNTRVRLDNNLLKGQYFYTVKNEKGELIANGKLLNQSE